MMKNSKQWQARRPQELRYRLADALNDQLKRFGALHSFLKRLLDGRKQLGADRRSAKDRVSSQIQVESAAIAGSLPLPPLEMRELVGPSDVDAFDNPAGTPVYPYLPVQAYEEVFDFGCGCGRIARQLIQQRPQPRRYLGIDLHRGMIAWCQKNLSPIAPQFQFAHHDVFMTHFNSKSTNVVLPFPANDSEFTLVNALSVFTHLTEEQIAFYLRECARVLRPQGILHSSWFLFDKRNFPVLQEANNALYVHYLDPTAAVLFDRQWVRDTARESGLTIFRVVPPGIRGYQWALLMAPAGAGRPEVEIPEDDAPHGSVRLPMPRRNPEEIGQD